MPQRKSPSKHRSGSTRKAPTRRFMPRRRIPWMMIAVPIAVLAVFAIAGMGYAANMEERDTFCASCHTQPESTFFTRSTAGAPVDLASFHTAKNTKCIDCHSGAGITGRVGALMLGAHNAFAFYTKTAVQPAPLTNPIGDANCVKCHAETMQNTDFQNHFHAFLTRWQSIDLSAAGCASCHTGHNIDGNVQIAYLNQQTTEQVCQQCHNRLREGGG